MNSLWKWCQHLSMTLWSSEWELWEALSGGRGYLGTDKTLWLSLISICMKDTGSRQKGWLICVSSSSQTLLMPHVGVVHVPQTIWLALRYFETSSFLYAVGDAENLSKNTVCSAILEVAHALTGLAHSFVVFPATCPTQTIKEGFYNIAGIDIVMWLYLYSECCSYDVIIIIYFIWGAPFIAPMDTLQGIG